MPISQLRTEFGITLSRDLEPGMTIDDIAKSVQAVHPLLELHNLQLRSDRPHGPE